MDKARAQRHLSGDMHVLLYELLVRLSTDMCQSSNCSSVITTTVHQRQQLQQQSESTTSITSKLASKTVLHCCTLTAQPAHNITDEALHRL
jgi:hypothetical protein